MAKQQNPPYTKIRRNPLQRFFALLRHILPKSLFARSLIIVVAPMVLLQSVLTFVFLERHWQLVTQRMSQAVARDIAALVTILENYSQEVDYSTLTRIAQEDFGFRLDILPSTPLPAPAPKPFFNLLDRTLAREINNQVGKPFWIDTVGRTDLIEVRIKLDQHILRLFARRSQAYATNSHIFLVWMVGASLVLLIIAILFLRGQIRPIQRLAKAARQFGRGRAVPDLHHTGAREVRQASEAFVDMSKRIERQVEQRTIMLAGVSHDLRTVLTRFRLQLAMLPPSADTKALGKDIAEMEHMLQDYMAFASGSTGEAVANLDLPGLLKALCADAKRQGLSCSFTHEGESEITVRPGAFKRCLANLLSNACHHASTIKITSRHNEKELSLHLEDDGPGIPEAAQEDVFKPFFRLDAARNQNQSGTGLGLSIARDIALVHGGEIILSKSRALGGLCAEVRLPV